MEQKLVLIAYRQQRLTGSKFYFLMWARTILAGEKYQSILNKIKRHGHKNIFWMFLKNFDEFIIRKSEEIIMIELSKITPQKLQEEYNSLLLGHLPKKEFMSHVKSNGLVQVYKRRFVFNLSFY